MIDEIKKEKKKEVQGEKEYLVRDSKQRKVRSAPRESSSHGLKKTKSNRHIFLSEVYPSLQRMSVGRWGTEARGWR